MPPGRRALFVFAFCGCSVLSLNAFVPFAAFADVFSEFQKARQAYRKHDYSKAIKLFEALVGGETSVVENQALRLESRKYLGASYLFEKRPKEAAEQFRLLLREDPTYRLDPLSFPAKVLDVFSEVQGQVEKERSAELAANSAQGTSQNGKPDVELSRAEHMQVLVDLAETERIQQNNSRWLALLPFGVGQFQNGHDGLGMVLAVSQAALCALSLASFLVYQTIDIPPKLVGQESSADRLAAQDAEQAWYYVNVTSTALFAVLAIVGIADAQMRFKDTIERKARRPLPDELREGIHLSLQPSHTSFDIRF